MDTSRSIMPENKSDNWYIQILNWCFEHAIVWTSFILGWKALDILRKMIRERREDKIRAIVQEEINKSIIHRLDSLSDNVERLGDAVFKLNTKL